MVIECKLVKVILEINPVFLPTYAYVCSKFVRFYEHTCSFIHFGRLHFKSHLSHPRQCCSTGTQYKTGHREFMSLVLFCAVCCSSVALFREVQDSRGCLICLKDREYNCESRHIHTLSVCVSLCVCLCLTAAVSVSLCFIFFQLKSDKINRLHLLQQQGF